MRDLLRRRGKLVSRRTALLVSFKSLCTRTTGGQIALKELKAMNAEEAAGLYEHPANQLIAQIEVEQIEGLSRSIRRIERAVLTRARQIPLYPKLLTLPGVGPILGMTITMEVGDIKRFRTDGNFASYCRAVGARRTSNGKQKGQNNQKCGNRYLSWAFVEAANFAKRYDAESRRWFDRKKARTSTVIATKALACKLTKAAWHVMAQGTDYDPARMFPGERKHFESRRQPAKGLGKELFGLIGRQRFSFWMLEGQEHILQSIRPCRESQKGWPRTGLPAGNHNFPGLNERGPALKVFWIPECRDWAQDYVAWCLGAPFGVFGRRLKKRAGGRPEPQGLALFGSKGWSEDTGPIALEPDG